MNAVLLSLALATWPTIDLDQEVTYENPGGTLTAVLGQLGQSTDVEFDVHQDIEKEVVVVRVQKVPLNKTLDKIAEVTGGKWFESNGKVKFIVDLDHRSRDENEFVRSLLTEIATWKERLETGSKTQKYKDEDGEEYTIEPSASDILLNHLIRQIPNATLAQLRSGDRVVFSTNPTQAQRPMPGFNTALIEKWIAEHNESISDDPQGQLDGLDEIPPEILERMMARFKKFEGTPSRMMLVLQDGSQRFMMGGGSMVARLVLYNQAGKAAIEAASNLGSERWQDMIGVPEDISGDGEVQEKPAKPQTKITYPEELTKLEEEFNKRYQSGMPQKMPAKVMEMLQAVDVHEPLAMSIGYSLVGAARTKGVNVVASPEDAMAGSGPTINLAPTVEQLQQQLDSRLIETDGWWTFKPADPKTDRETRIDRKSLAAFLKAAKESTPTLEQVAKLFADNDVRDSYGFFIDRITMLCPQAVSNIMQQLDPQEYRLFGQLSVSQRTALKNGSRVSISQLSPAAQQTLRRLVYGAGTNLEVLVPGKEFDRQSLIDSLSLFDGIGDAGDLKTEPTLVAPSGLPMNGYIAARVTEQTYFVIPSSPEVPSELSVQLGYDEMAIFRAMMSVPQFAAEAGEIIPMFDKMNRGLRDEWDIRIFVAADVAHKIELNDARPPGKETYSIRNLPPDIEAIVAAKAEAIKKSPFFSMIGSMGPTSNGPIKP